MASTFWGVRAARTSARTSLLLALSAIGWAACGGASDLQPVVIVEDAGVVVGDGGKGGEGGNGLCGPGTVQCGATCTVVAFDPQNCGACGHACAKGQSCSGGSCGSEECNGGTTACGAACVDLQNDPAHCGKCGVACPLGQVCSGGKCDLFCNGNTTKCNNACVDTSSDPKNCGQCGNQCAQGQVCFKGGCAAKCGGATQQCGQACVDTQWDPANCGACGHACASSQVCSQGQCGSTCGGGLVKCGNDCVDTANDPLNCGQCGHVCTTTDLCIAGACSPCNSATTDCDGDGWKVSDGDCCDKPGTCGSEPKLVNPGAVEVVGNGIDDNCNNLVDLFDTLDTQPCDQGLQSNTQVGGDYAKAIGVCRQTTLGAPLPQRTWGLIDATILRADGRALQATGDDWSGISIRPKFGSTIVPLNGSAMAVLSSGIASDAAQTQPGPNGGAPTGTNVTYIDVPPQVTDVSQCSSPMCVRDWFMTPNPPLKQAAQLPAAPNCGGTLGAPSTANDSIMLVLTMRAPTNARAFSFNSFFLSAEYPEWVCTTFNDQYIALVDTPSGTPSPIANPVDKNLMTYVKGGKKYPIAINIAGIGGTTLFSVCDALSESGPCMGTKVDQNSCSLGAGALAGTGFESPATNPCLIGGGTYWLTTAGNVVPGQIVQIRIAIWDVGDASYDSLALIDGFQWLANATLPGTN
jgi:hypothetical protein